MNKKIELNPAGNLLMYKKGFSISFVEKTINELKLDGLRIFDHLDPLDSLNFLKEFTFLKQLDIEAIKADDYEFLKSLPDLKSLAIGFTKSQVLDLSGQTNLSALYIQWRKNISGLENCTQLEILSIADYFEKDFYQIKMMVNLKMFSVRTASIINLHGLEECNLLEDVLFANCKSLRTIKVLNGKKNLKSIQLNTCPKIQDYDELIDLPVLEELEIIDCKKMPSIKFIANFKTLKKLSILGNTDIMDSDLIPAQNINEVIHRSRAHYNIKIENKKVDEITKQNMSRIKNV